MALIVNSTEGKGGGKLYTGINNFKIISICPSQEEYKTILGFDKDKEPTYVSEEHGIKKVRIEFWADNGDVDNPCKVPVSFFIEDKEVVNKNGDKRQVINLYGASTWLPLDGEVPENMSWYDVTGVRTCKVGEEELTSFIKNYINHNSKEKQEAQLNIDAFLNGDFSQLKAIISNNKIKLGLGVSQKTADDGKIRYNQMVYTKMTERSYGDGERIKTSINESKSGGYLANIYFGEPDYTFTKVSDASKLAFFQADKPQDLVSGTNTAPAF